MCDKSNAEKHQKYIDFYKNCHATSNIYWGIGIENESYLMPEKTECVKNDFLKNNTKRERYSLDYFLNYDMEEYKKTVSAIENVTVPYYINGYMFQNMDIYGETKTLYTKGVKLNKKYSGMSIHEYMVYVSKIYNKLFEKHVIFDGDTIEFTTNKFYKTTVNDTINELTAIKKSFLREVNTYLANKFVFSGYGNKFQYPSHNYGFVKYMTNQNNIGICNNGTYHINITLPTELSLCGMKIKDPVAFKTTHRNAIRLIQWIEPLIIALYGSPDILSCMDDGKRYAKGSLRLKMSRYIGLGTYDTDKMIPGKLLQGALPRGHPVNPQHVGGSPAGLRSVSSAADGTTRSAAERNQCCCVCANYECCCVCVNSTCVCERHIAPRGFGVSPCLKRADPLGVNGVKGAEPLVYKLPLEHGYDFNYNKFKNHGIELRILDYFPEEYLKDIINFLILVCRHSLDSGNTIPKIQNSALWNELAGNCIQYGSDAMVSNDMYLLFRDVFGMNENVNCCFSLFRQNKERPILKVIQKISDFLYEKYHDDERIVKKMSPSMKKIVWTDYNKIIREKYRNAITFVI